MKPVNYKAKIRASFWSDLVLELEEAIVQYCGCNKCINICLLEIVNFMLTLTTI